MSKIQNECKRIVPINKSDLKKEQKKKMRELSNILKVEKIILQT